MKQNRVLGITGGVGCGKSTVMALLRQHFHAKTIVADEIGHQAMSPGEKPYQQIIDKFGESIVLPSGELNRPMLANAIYEDDKKRECLNQIIHPYVLQEIRKTIQQWSEEPLVAIETALMFETGCHRLCDTVWYIRTEPEIRIQRLIDSRGYSRERAEAIMAAQVTDEEGMRQSDAIIENNGSVKKIINQLQELLGIERKM